MKKKKRKQKQQMYAVLNEQRASVIESIKDRGSVFGYE